MSPMSQQASLDFERRLTLGSRDEIDQLFAQLERPLDPHMLASGLASLRTLPPAHGRDRR